MTDTPRCPGCGHPLDQKRAASHAVNAYYELGDSDA